MSIEKQPIVPPSNEPEEKAPMSPDEQRTFEAIEKDLSQPYNPEDVPVEDKKRPLPDEEEWGVPGADRA